VKNYTADSADNGNVPILLTVLSCLIVASVAFILHQSWFDARLINCVTKLRAAQMNFLRLFSSVVAMNCVTLYRKFLR
jgi:hypothetical protein